ncbi:MAG TPA: class I adenylate-forming enzyme family protein [Bacteroidota bacterium]|nr:class I adenylate-forming enzyme family protein [Bacteroidota bacterium]
MIPATRTTASLIASARAQVGPAASAEGFTSVADLLFRRRTEYRDDPFIIFYGEGSDHPEILSYGSFADEVFRTVRLLIDRNISPGARVAIVAHNHPDTIIQYFACWMLGAVVVPVNTGEDDHRIGYILKDSSSVLAFVRSEYLARILPLRTGLPLLTDIVVAGNADFGRHPDVQGPAFSELLRRYPAEPPGLPAPDPEQDAFIVYTSGTTGNPKGVVLTHGNLLADAGAIAAWHELTPGQRMMCVLPIHHVNGTLVTVLTPLRYGGSVVLNQKFHPGSFFRRIAEHGVHIVSVVPTLLQFLLHDRTAAATARPPSLRHIICGAGPLTCELATAFEDRFGVPVIHGYGLSETTCYSSFLPIDLPAEEHRRWLTAYGFPSIGVPLPVNEMAIHDSEGQPLPPGQRGEIVIRGSNVMKGYFGNEEANASAFAHGWFRSGDEGFYMEENGRRFFFITGRIKELILRGGVNISPFEIDEILMNIAGVKAGLAVGFENDWYGEEIGAYVQRNTDSRVTEEDILRICREHFPYAKCPKVVIFGDDIPVTSTGKYQRKKLTPLFRAWKEVQFSERKRSEE